MSHDSNVWKLEKVEKVRKVGKVACFPVVSSGRTFRKSGFELLKTEVHKKLRKVEKTRKVVKIGKSQKSCEKSEFDIKT